MHTSLFVLAFVALQAPYASAQLEVGGSLLDSCSQIDGLRKSGKFAEAKEKALQCIQGLEQQTQGDVSKSFPAAVAGWQRTKLEQNQVLGFNNITATYKKENTTATVSLTGGQSGNALGGLLGGIVRMGAQAGQQVRVAGLPASVQPDGAISVTMEKSSFLTFQSTAFRDQQSALAGLGDLVNAFPVAEINKKLK
jgi:hypothetical protein